MGYHQRFHDALAAAQPQAAYPGGAGGAPGLLPVNAQMRDEDVDALVAYLALLRRLIERVRGSRWLLACAFAGGAGWRTAHIG